MDLELWWKDLSTSWKNIFKSEIDIDRNPSKAELESIIQLKRIDCSDSVITSVEPLSILTDLKILLCRNTGIKYLDKLKNLSSLEELDFSKTKVYSLLPLAELKNLKKLDCSNTKIQSLDGLQELDLLEDLLCTSTEVTSLEPLRQTSTLKYLNISKTKVTEIDPILHLLEIDQLKFLADNSPVHEQYTSYLLSKEYGSYSALNIDNKDELFDDCARLIVQTQSGSTSNLQRRFNLGYNRAGRIMDQLEAAGIVGPSVGSKLREVYVKSEFELEAYL